MLYFFMFFNCDCCDLLCDLFCDLCAAASCVFYSGRDRLDSPEARLPDLCFLCILVKAAFSHLHCDITEQYTDNLSVLKKRSTYE